MRAISITQPWASLIVSGAKTIETRTHPGLRGAVGHRIAIHASALPRDADDIFDALCNLCGESDKEPEFGATRAELLRHPKARLFGAVIGTAFAVELRELTYDDEPAAQCPIGDNRWGLILRDARQLPVPIPAKGMLGVWGWAPPENFEDLRGKGGDHRGDDLGLFQV